ncbi:ABC transporter ATP-binding protein [Gorillibacterium sp. CAU 1737]|uniref:ABC transporter ATP-binding protein n=1 Tax=Gorillibacterium sp. CAU 1737 TaxID=3140362 RepID=UPI0032618448
MDSILSVKGLSKRYGEFEAVRSLDFALVKGRATGLLGPNGAGKTTTLSMLSGLLPATSGSIQVAGDAGGDRRERIGYLPQHPVFFNWMTGREYMKFAGELFGLKGTKLRARAGDLLEQLGLADAARKRIGSYSGGMKQRLGIAQALIHRPELLILDEPVSALDPVGRRELIDLLQGIKRETTLLFSTHVLHDAEQLCDDILILNKGELAVQGQLAELRRLHGKPHLTVESEESLVEFAEAVRRNPAIRRIELSEDQRRLVLEADHVAQARDYLFAEIAQRRLPVQRFDAANASLEALFLEVVGA